VIDIYDGTYYSTPAYSSPSFFRSAGGTVFFEVDDRFGGGDTYGEVLWTTDGTEAGTSLLKDTKPGNDQGGFRAAGDWAALNGTLYFPADDGANGIELWKSDGTTTGTQMIKDIHPSGDGVPTDEFAVYNGEVYFAASDGTNGLELWKTDGTTGGTVRVKDVHPHSFVVFSNELFFTTASDCYLWKTDGTESGTVRVADRVCPTPTKLTAVGSTLFFSGFTNGQDRDLWAYNGSTAQIVKNIAPSEITDPRHLTAFNGKLYFTVETGASGRELWTSDGTDTGTHLLTDINPGPDSALDTRYGPAPDFTIVDDQLFFVADDGTNGDELWVTDGTSAGTHLVKDLTSGSYPPHALTAMGGRVYFAVSTAAYGEEVWSSDGTAANTVLLADIKDGSGSSRPSALFAHDGTLYFGAEDETHGDELRVSNGVPSVTTTVTSDATVDFEETGVDLAFSGVGAAGEVTVEKLNTSPSGTDGLPSGETVSSYRFVIKADEALSFTSADVRLDVSTLGGVNNPGRVDLYKRPTSGSGSFTKLTTSYEPSPKELRATVSSFSEFVLVSDTDPLPVELAGFDARLSDDAVALRWKTASETNNAGFRVQRRVGAVGPSSEAREAGVDEVEAGWQTVGRRTGAGTTTEPQSYRFTDDTLPYAADRLTYRLKQIDTDGTTSISDPVTVGRRAVEQVQLLGTYPNPAHQQATMRFALPEGIDASGVQLRLFDVLGRQVRAMRPSADAGRHGMQLDVSTLPSGLYVLHLTAGSTVKTQRVTVVR
jgi:ELWxxDGT repeat protein